ncbi:MAG: peptide ABC transporter substrate-binding protein [Anaerolineae bacterium]|nr:peptide ABC transporter substrate-binding protein [Anaerolineae bacterium]
MKSNRIVSLFGLTAATSMVLAACASPTPTPAPAKPAEPAKPAAPAAPAGKRGSGGAFRILYWQAPTILNPHLANGTKDYDASRLIYEPLAAIAPDGNPSPVLAAEIPTVANGGIAADLKSLTWKLKKGVKWHDGSDFTADDVVFTWEYCSNKDTGCSNAGRFQGVTKVTAVDANTVKVEYDAPQAYMYRTFTGSNGMILSKKHMGSCIGANASKDAECQKKNTTAPVGTGPYKLKEFKSGDQATYEVNTSYHVADQPFFKEVLFKGGGDATSAARAVFQTGDTDYAWNLQVEAAVLQQLQQGGKGDLKASTGGNVERIMFQPFDIDPSRGEDRGEAGKPHPFFGDANIRKAFSIVIDRKTMAETLYGPAGDPTCEIITWQPYIAPDQLHGGRNKCATPDFDTANKILDDAGWKKGADGIRAKDGKKMKVSFSTSVNPLRQKEQALMKDAWTKLGVEVDLKAIDAAVFFSTDAGSPDTIGKFWYDIQMYTNGSGVPDAGDYICEWETEDISNKANGWRKPNNIRYSNKDFDAICKELKSTTDPAKNKELVLKANDLILYKDYAVSPLIARKSVSGIAKGVNGVNMSPWDSEMWNIATWTK